MAGQLDLERSSHDPWGFEVPFDAAGLVREAAPAWPAEGFAPETLAWEDQEAEEPETLGLAGLPTGEWEAEAFEADESGEGEAEADEAFETGEAYEAAGAVGAAGAWNEGWGEDLSSESGVALEGFDEAPLAFEDEQFASGLVLQRASGATGKGGEHWDPNNTGLPLLATGPGVQAQRLSRSFTVRDLVTSGGRAAPIARISPALVRALQAIADRAGKPVRVTSGYRSWARNVAVYKRRGKRPTLSRHCAGQAADIKVAGMGGVALAKLAIDAVGPHVAIGIGRDFIHVDVRGKGITWAYSRSTGRAQVDEVRRYRAARAAGGAPGAILKEGAPTDTRAGQARSGVVGRLVIARHPMLQGHAGTPPDLVLRWNRVTPGAVDVVVHLHGFSGKRGRMELPRDKEPMSGLDFADPEGGEVGRLRPTIAVLPRGRYYGGRSGMGYDFPALTRPGAIDELVADALARFTAQTGIPVTRGRLVLTAHSGGGAAVGQILRHTDPDEVHVFDGLYGPGTTIVRWAARRIAREAASPSQVPPALRVLYIAGSMTAPHSEHVARQLRPLLERSRSAALARVMRVDAVGVGHNHIPRRYGWRLLADPGAELPKARRHAAPRPAGLQREGELEGAADPEATFEWAAEPATLREASMLEAAPAWPAEAFGPETLAWEDQEHEAPETLDLGGFSTDEWEAEAFEADESGEGEAEADEAGEADEAWSEGLDEASETGGAWETGEASGEAGEAGEAAGAWEATESAGAWSEAFGEATLASESGVALEGFDEEGVTANRAARRVPYQAAGSSCTGGPTPGARALAAQWQRLTGRRGGIYNCRSVRGSTRPSLHGEGRAIDAYCNAHRAVERAQGDAYAAWLVANAVELQVQYVIWNRRQWSWSKRAQGWRPYAGASPHEDHLHIELTWEGARSPSALFGGGVPGLAGTPSRPGPAPSPVPAPATGQRLGPRAFVAAFRAHALASQAATGVPALVTLGQAALESGWGERAPRFNFFGIKAKASDPPETRQLLRTREVLARSNVTGFPEVISVTPRPDGRFTYIVRDWFRAYPSAHAAFLAHGQFLTRNKRYAPAFAHTGDPFAFATAVARAGYATDPSYAQVLHKVMRTLQGAGA